MTISLTYHSQPSCDPSHALDEVLSLRQPRPNHQSDYLTDTPKLRLLLLQTFLGFQNHEGEMLPEEAKKLRKIAYSEYVSPCSPIVLKRWGHKAPQDGMYDDNDMDLGEERGSAKFPTLFYGFPKTLVIAGDAERLTLEIGNLIQVMEKDGIDIEAKWIPDAVHDILVMNWDKKVTDSCWADIADWMCQLRDQQ